MYIREIQPKDIDAVYFLLKDYFYESAYCEKKFDDDKAYVLAGRSLIDGSSYGLAIFDDDEMVGVFLGVVSEYIFNADKFAQDELVYVKPTHRGKFPIRSVLKQFERWAEGNGADSVRLSVLSGISTDRTTSLYNILGYHTTGTFVSKEI